MKVPDGSQLVNQVSILAKENEREASKRGLQRLPLILCESPNFVPAINIKSLWNSPHISAIFNFKLLM